MEFCCLGFLSHRWLPAMADEFHLPGFSFWVCSHSLLIFPDLTTRQRYYLPVVGTRLMSARACPRAGGPTHCISRAFAAPRSSTIMPRMLDPSYHVLSRGGIVEVLNSVEAMYWQKDLRTRLSFHPQSRLASGDREHMALTILDAYTILWYRPPAHVSYI